MERSDLFYPDLWEQDNQLKGLFSEDQVLILISSGANTNRFQFISAPCTWLQHLFSTCNLACPDLLEQAQRSQSVKIALFCYENKVGRVALAHCVFNGMTTLLVQK